MVRHLAGLAALAFSLEILPCGVAEAQAPSDAPVAQVAAPAASADVEGRERFEEGRVAYDEGRFDDALAAFRRAYLLSGRYQLLHNVGIAALRAEQHEVALEAFEGFLRQAPLDAPERPEVEERVRMLRGLVDQPEPERVEEERVVLAEPARGEVELPRRRTTAAPWALLGGGVAVAAAGGLSMGLGSKRMDEITAATEGARWDELVATRDRAQAMWVSGQVMIGVGAAAAVGGLVWGLVGTRGRDEGTARVSVGLGSIAFEGSF